VAERSESYKQLVALLMQSGYRCQALKRIMDNGTRWMELGYWTRDKVLIVRSTYEIVNADVSEVVGWDVFRPITESTAIDETLDAVRAYIEGR
jgi:hypothetical protein